jgi:peptide-methionine (S)-S-oxide reductase
MFFFGNRFKATVPSAAEALPDRQQPITITEKHAVLGTPIKALPSGHEEVWVGLGCFWGAERIFWKLEGVYSTAVGYAGGHTANPTYDEVCSGRTAHTEAVRVVFDPSVLAFSELLRSFWESHDPTQGMRQGNDQGTQYRSAIFTTTDAQLVGALSSAQAYGDSLKAAGHGSITTEICPADAFYYAEDYHQQYLAKNPGGYCGLGGTGVSCPVGVLPED